MFSFQNRNRYSRRWWLLTLVGCFNGSIVQANEDQVLLDTWQRYIQNCGSILAQPEQAISEFPLNEPGHVLASQNDGTRIIYASVSEDYKQSVSVEMGVSEQQITWTCSVGHSFIQGGFDPVIASAKLTEMVAATPQLSILGGVVQFESGSLAQVYNFTGGSDLYSHSVLGAFVGMDVITLIDLSGSNLTIFHMTALERKR